MELDDDLCVCFHVTRRKVVNFLRVEKPQRVGQLADCFGAGTGCGWCRPFLQRLFEDAQRGESSGDTPAEEALPTGAQYAERRQAYLDAGLGKPPAGAAAGAADGAADGVADGV
jgi:NAD(P)H-nitrite reductase large subunit